ncbi:hypothetical protein BH24DEI2_BH24DEI2_18820 [soil metagenome]
MEGRGLELGELRLPALVVRAGEETQRSFVEFFVANIRNKNTRKAYARAVGSFLGWCEVRGLTLAGIDPIAVSAYIEGHPGSAPTVKQHLAAIRMLFDWLVRHGSLKMNPASVVRGPRYVTKKGKTPVLEAEDARHLLDTIYIGDINDTANLKGLRDRALIGTMLYSFARVGAVVNMALGDYYHVGRRSWLRLLEKGGKHHEVPVHHTLIEYLDAYIEVGGTREQESTFVPEFRPQQAALGAAAGRAGCATDVEA